MEAACAPSLGALSYVMAISEAENRQKWSVLNQYISVTTNIDEKSLCFFEHTTYDLYYGHIYSAFDKSFPYYYYYYYFSYHYLL